MLTIKIKSYNHNLINFYIKKLKKLNLRNQIKIGSLPTQYKRFTVKKSPHVFGRSKERFTFSVHNKIIKLAIKRGNDLNQFLNFIHTNRYEGLGIQVCYSSTRKI